MAKETSLLRVKRHHSFGVNLNLVLFIPQEIVFLPTVKSFWGKKKQFTFTPKVDLFVPLVGWHISPLP